MDNRRRLPVRSILGCLFFAFLIWQAAQFLFGSKPQVGRETTFVTGPMKPDGSIDYPAALHERLSEGLKPEDNAAILIDRAFGLDILSPQLRSQYLDWIGAEPPADKDSFVVSQSELMQRKSKEAGPAPELNEKMYAEFARVQRQPWNRIDSPLAAEWLDMNAKPLELIEQATRRSRYYSPFVTSTGLLEAESTVQNLRESIRLLTARAMFRLGADDVEGAWSDLLAGHRLAELVSQHSSTSINYMVAIAVNSVAAQGDAALIAHGLSLEQAEKCLEEFDRVPPFGSLADALNEGDRFTSLDASFQMVSQMYMDLNTMLRDTNRTYDEIIAAMKILNVTKRRQALEGIDQETKTRIARARKPLRLIAGLIINTRRTITRNIGDVLLGNLMPAFVIANSAQVRNQIRRDEIRIGFSLAAFHADHGKYPQTLDELAPKYLAEVPLDQYTEKPLVYVPREDGFLIYSIGPNGKDDGGRTRGAANEDDIPFEVPPKIDE